MARDIEEFLRRAAERRKQQQQQQQRQPPARPRKVRQVIEPADIEIVDPIQVVPPARQQPARNIQTKTTKRRNLRDQSVSDHVRQHIDTSDVSEHAEHLGQRIQRADDVIARRIHQKFDHDVGRLDDMPTVQDDAAPTVEEDEISQLAADLLKMLTRPESVCQAILISEILSRPNFD